jgi:hypothetical protein
MHLRLSLLLAHRRDIRSTLSERHPSLGLNVSAVASYLLTSSVNVVPSTAPFGTEADLESHVPSLPTGWAVGGVEGVKRAAVASREAKAKRKTRHALPKFRGKVTRAGRAKMGVVSVRLKVEVGRRCREVFQDVWVFGRYRLGEYQRAQELYDDLLASCDSVRPPDVSV